MSDLKYKTVEQLEEAKVQSKKYLSSLMSKANGEETRLEWIEKYIFEKTPKELTMKQIEHALGHKVILKHS
ncbi:hypothetical protein OAD61_00445 [bacterium]|nr:hypothetical protein [bacterium]